MNSAPFFSNGEQAVIFSADKAIVDCLEENNLLAASEMLERYRGLKRVSDLATSKLLHGVNQHWNDLPHEEGLFSDWVYRVAGYHRLTTIRHISTWEMLSLHVPEEFKDKFMGQTMRQLWKEFSLVVLAQENSTGNYDFLPAKHEVSKDDWRDLSEAIDEHRTAEIVAKIKDKERTANLLALRMDANGDVWVHGKKDRRFVFSLPVSNTDELVKRAVEKVVSSSGIRHYENP